MHLGHIRGCAPSSHKVSVRLKKHGQWHPYELSMQPRTFIPIFCYTQGFCGWCSGCLSTNKLIWAMFPETIVYAWFWQDTVLFYVDVLCNWLGALPVFLWQVDLLCRHSISVYFPAASIWRLSDVHISWSSHMHVSGSPGGFMNIYAHGYLKVWNCTYLSLLSALICTCTWSKSICHKVWRPLCPPVKGHKPFMPPALIRNPTLAAWKFKYNFPNPTNAVWWDLLLSSSHEVDKLPSLSWWTISSYAIGRSLTLFYQKLIPFCTTWLQQVPLWAKIQPQIACTPFCL